MINNDYSHKPKDVRTLPNLIAFLQGIPDDNWTTGVFQDAKGRRCVAGHINAAYRGGDPFTQIFFHDPSLLPVEINPYDLVMANNGTTLRGSSAVIKARVIAFLNTHQPLPTEALAA